MPLRYLLLLPFLMLGCSLWAQDPVMREEFDLKGRVVSEASETPIPGIEVGTDRGPVVRTDALGEFRIRAAEGDVLIVRGPDIQTVRYRIRSRDDIKIVVQGDPEPEAFSSSKNQPGWSQRHRQLLDSANYYKRTDIRKSLDFITQSIEILGDRSSRRELARSLTTLGEVYQYHRQYDLAISNYREALDTFETFQTLLLLGKAYVLSGAHDQAITLLEREVGRTGLVPYQRLELYETLGDAYRGQGKTAPAVSYYQQALAIAEKNQIAPKVPDLNSKIADAYDAADRTLEAEAYYDNSLREAASQNPVRAVQESEKVADFYSKRSRYPEEIALRKESLEKLKALDLPVEQLQGDSDSITTQGLNYKIGRAYIAQARYEEAIPFLSESMKEANTQGDLVVQKDATRKLSELYRNRGDFEKALDFYQQYVALVDTLYIRKEQELARAARFTRELSSRQNRISSLEQERQLSQSKYDLALAEQRLTREINKRQKFIIYSLVFGILLTGLAAFFYYRSNRQKELANHLLALKGLRTQMNPHFIFNALNSVNHYIARNDERSANRYLSDFSLLMRTVLENSEKDFIPLSEELELLELYLKLEHTRFPDKFDYRIAVDPEVDPDTFTIPPMLLQPYLENAVWHGLRYKAEKGLLELEVKPLSQGVLQVSITDDGVGRKRSAALKTKNQKKQKSKGMGNIRRRIEILNRMYGDRITVSVYDGKPDGSGTRVVLILRKK
ncbi:tetratricopeptide repeat protein [Robiginitalea sp. M366]|uniref:tetratricopeptide repeat protein n=1 Tax=Robiginitalea aestuariiviva TaxID=3036903 RepID=UPI00240D30FB|nr:tetratricopeptide repeat protein [Robiginitalea aestuariiviva]MDG1570981.1 tetratricopeptide repeat protein [Robiginitalea aestuariiviva]